MKNEFVDGPGAGTTDFIVADNSEKHFLFSIKYQTTFEAILVFVHPNRSPTALAGVTWIAEATYFFKWIFGSIHATGKSSRCGKTGTMDQAALNAIGPFLTSPPRAVLGQIANPNLVTSMTLPAADGKTFLDFRAINPFNFFE